VNPNATEEARRLMKFLADSYGHAIIAGQQDLTWDDSVDMIQRVESKTGKKPALMGFDMMNMFDKGGSGRQQVMEAANWWKTGGIVVFCWHWREGASREFYTEKTDFRIDLDPSSSAYKAIVADIDAAAGKLKALAEAKVPVLWRPLHEASGGWFWWGASGPQACIGLWKLIYERMTKLHNLDNLIWVWNGQNRNWYPGDEYVDIIGEDIYDGDRNYSSRVEKFRAVQGYVRGAEARMAAITENGAMPDPDALVRDGALWSWFMTWTDGNAGREQDDFFSGKKFTDDEMKKKIYNHPYVLTLDELPDLKSYPLEATVPSP
jgi:mannan endo-1,4-beta-mannosidase